MGFFGLDDTPPPKSKQQSATRGVNIQALREAGCSLCPLNDAQCKSPKMEPEGGAKGKTMIYILGDAPSRAADRANRPFAGDAGSFILSKIPAAYRGVTRFNNVIRTHPGQGEEAKSLNRDNQKPYVYTKTPDPLAIEACRNSIEQDILRHKPEIVITIGAVPLRWIAGETHAYLWQGRRFPAKLGDHKFWVYPFTHPYDAMKGRRWDSHIPDDEATWLRHFKEVFRYLESGDVKTPVIHTEERARENVHWVMGEGSEDLKRIEGFLDDCAQQNIIGKDYETSVLRPYQDNSRILTVALTNKEETLAFPFDHKEAKWTRKQRNMLGDMYREFLLDPRPTKVAHQLAFEMEWSAYEFGVSVCRGGKWGDTISQAYVLNERQGMLSLEVLTRQYYGIDIKSLSTVNRKNMSDEPLAKILPYNGIDAKYHRALYLKQAPLIREQGLEDVYAHQLSRIPTLVLTQLQGVPINQEELAGFRAKFEMEQSKALQALKGMTIWDAYKKLHGEEFRPSASFDVIKMLKIIGSKVKKTDEATLKKIDHPFIPALIKWRKPTKILGTYCDGVTAGMEDSHLMPDGKVHPIISTYKVETWRTSSEEPNIQNWPKRGPNVVIRKIVAKPGHKVVSFDYAGIQARNICMESGDSALQKSFIDWYDIHGEWVENFAKAFPKWAPRGLGKDKNVFKNARSVIKNKFVFPAFFGAQAKSITPGVNELAFQKDVTQEGVQEMLDDLFGQFPEVHKWHARLKKFYEKHGYVTGHSGFKRRAPISYNQLINSPIQADEAIIVCSAYSALSEIDHRKYQAMMEIHDDLTFMWPEKEVEKRAEVVIREMLKIRFDWINVPLVVEMNVGDNWCDLERVGDFESVGTDEYREVKHG
jgi:uracil-DNA glycosylase family 4